MVTPNPARNQYKKISTLVGELTLIRNKDGLSAILWEGEKLLPKNAEQRDEDKLLQQAEEQLKEYFLGQRQEFDLVLAPEGTEFQKTVWEQLKNIPFGETRTYGDIAKAVGDVRKARAVGNANNRNPLPIVVPCHRVIGSDGKLVGFAGGLNVKRQLLDLESRIIIQTSCHTLLSGTLHEPSITVHA